MRNHQTPARAAGSRFKNQLIGWTLYPLGDLIGQLIMGEVSLLRLLLLSLAGGLIYSFEVPAWFGFLDRLQIKEGTLTRFPVLRAAVRRGTDRGRLNWLGKTLGAMLYFNPLWIARHVFIIMLATAAGSQFSLLPSLLAALAIGSKSFLTNLPLSVLGNYLIQERLSFKHRFLGSVIMSGILAVKYALEYVLFR